MGFLDWLFSITDARLDRIQEKNDEWERQQREDDLEEEDDEIDDMEDADY